MSFLSEIKIYDIIKIIKNCVNMIKKSRFKPGGFQKVKVPRFRENCRGWWYNRPNLKDGNTKSTQGI
jgi:hypothetical protein